MSGQNLLLLGAVQQAVPDPYFEYTTLLLPGNGTNGAQNNTFLDSSTNAFSITRNGNTTQGSFSPFSQTGWSNYFDGTGDYLSIARNSVFLPGASTDFTVEAWVYPIAISAAGSQILGMGEFGDRANTDWSFALNADRTVYFYLASTNVARTTAATVTLNAWNHVAVARTGTGSNNLTIYVNGVGQSFTETGAFTYSGSSQLTIGADVNGDEGLYTGYFSNIRMVNGTAVYSGATITVPTAPLTAVTNTCLLTCQSNRFIDNSTNAFAITRNGDVSVQAFSPFNPTAAWSAATNGGSGYFDGSGDYLSIANNAAFDASSTWCAECWVYPTYTSGNDKTIFGNQQAISYPTNYPGWDFIAATPTTVAFRWGYPNYTDTGSFSYSVYAWNHLAVSISGGRLSFYVNGTRVYTTTTNTSISASGAATYIGWSGNNSVFNGYIANARLVKGSTPYDPTQTTLTVPTAPLTAITNTSLLTNFTNAGIYDATSKNDLETVGNAQISTTQSKFGGSSMSFDGTGDYLYRAVNPNPLGSGDWTIEFWYYQSGGSSYRAAVSTRTAADGGATATVFCGFFGNNMYYDGSTSGGINVVGSATIANSTWYHCAYVRFGSTVTMYLNGVSQGSVSDSNNKSNPDVWVGGQNTLYYLNGYIDDLRITKGIARYTSNFTPPTTAFLTL